MGTNLKDSDQEVKPRIKEIVVKTNLAKNISSYLWAAVGVGLAFQEPWDKFFNAKGFKNLQNNSLKVLVIVPEISLKVIRAVLENIPEKFCLEPLFYHPFLVL